MKTPAPNVVESPSSLEVLSPDEFMFRQFRRHSRILRTPARHQYFMLSGGVNLFPMSSVWKGLISLEIENDLAYGWYTSQEGFPTLQRAVSMWENYAASLGRFPTQKPLGNGVCMTLGASQAVAAVFDYVSSCYPKSKVLLAGFTYPLFERCARHYQLGLNELLAEDDQDNRTLPTSQQLVDEINSKRPMLVVLTVPSNPSGEQYTFDEFKQIFSTAAEKGVLLLVDQAGQMPIAQDSWVNIENAIAQSESQEHVVLVNSFSKTDAVPGLRVGYLMGPTRVIEHASKYQLISTMNPPTFPVLPPFFSLLARCVHTGERQGWASYSDRDKLLAFAQHMFEVTAAIVPRVVADEMRSLLSGEGFAAKYDQYCHEQRNVGKAIVDNRIYLEERLASYISRTTRLQGGINYLVELEPFIGKEEDAICQKVFESTAVAILTESCFRISHRQRKNFWVRMSLAAPTDRFQAAVDRLADFLSKL